MEIQVKKFASSFTEFDKRMALPLVKIAQHLATAMVARIRRGQGAEQPLRPLGADAGPGSPSTLFWVRPGKPQPDGWVVKLTSGNFLGWAGYVSYLDYCKLRGGGPRDLDETGRFLASIAVRANGPNRVKVAPYGGHSGPSGEKISNTAVGYLASRGEPLPLLHPSRQEIVEAARLVFAEVDGQAIEAAAIAGIGFDARRKLASVQRRASKLLGG